VWKTELLVGYRISRSLVDVRRERCIAEITFFGMELAGEQVHGTL
jgi:hypothetical protein